MTTQWSTAMTCRSANLGITGSNPAQANDVTRLVVNNMLQRDRECVYADDVQAFRVDSRLCEKALCIVYMYNGIVLFFCCIGA